MKTFDELVEGIKELKKRGFIKAHRSDDTGIGKTLEDELGIEEKPKKEPDYYIGVGLCFGVAFGALYDNIGLGISLGLVLE